MPDREYAPIKKIYHAATGTSRRLLTFGTFDSLYKYRSLADDVSLERVRDIVVNNNLYWSPPDQLNDPFECQPTFIHKPDDDARERVYADFMADSGGAHLEERERHEHVTKWMDEYDNRIASQFAAGAEKWSKTTGILSFSATYSIRLLWSHYADSHKGICLQFTPGPDSQLLSALPMHYTDARPVINAAYPPNPMTFMMDMYLSKDREWSYEKEYRLFDPKFVGTKPYDRSDLTGIILGARISPQHRTEVEGWCANIAKPPIVYQAALGTSEFGVTVPGLD